jgi:CRISPR/Cas system Type II protein with McrA/HNH and RuvC-like nuclease domain
MNEKSRNWRKANPGKANEASRRWKKANHKKVKEYRRKYYIANSKQEKECSQKQREVNPEKVKEWNLNWRKANPEKANEASRRWRENNHEKRAAYQRNREARKMQADGTHTDADIQKLFAQQGGRCNACGKKLIRYNKKQYHVDHIEPLSRGGSNWPGNLQLLCPFCNLSKGDKDPIEWARENGRLF